MPFLDTIKTQIDKHQIISFDIFDTLLLRPYVKPTDLFLHLEKIENTANFSSVRIEAEGRARQKHSNKEDITIDEIYDEIGEKYQCFKEKEMKMERQVLVANPEMKEVYDYALSQGKRIIIVSDMYLPEDFLADVLKEKGYNGFEKLFVSSRYGKLKYSGNLFKEVVHELDILPKKILHIGDSKRNDYLMPQKLGLNACLYPNPTQHLLENNYRLRKLMQEHPNSLGFSMIIGAFCIWSINNKAADYWHKFGYIVAGPVCFNFINWIYNDLKNKHIDNLVFIARDGYILKKIFDLINDKKISTHYIYAPRSLNLICRLNYEKEGNFVYEHTQTILNFYKQKDKDLSGLSRVNTAKDGLKQIEDNIDKIRSLAEKEKENYKNYIKQKNIKGNIATVDSVSMFFSAQRFFEDLFPKNKFIGYYYQIQTGATLTDNVFSYKNIAPYSHDLKLIEFIMTAPEPPIRYIENGKPIYKEISDEERNRMNACEKFSETALVFAENIKKFFNSNNLYLTASEMYDFIENFIQFPDMDDKEAFSNVLFAYDPEHKKYIHLFDFWQTNRIEHGLDVILPFCNFPIFTLKKRHSFTEVLLLNIPVLTISQIEELQ